MPRDGSNIYHYPTGIEGNPDEIIESAGYNSFLADVEQDANLPRPILAGGTGATSAEAALAALGGEMANQQVTNYDSYIFKPGSFYSQPGATNAPIAGTNFTGTAAIVANNPDYINLEAVDNNSGNVYRRQKTAGVWGAWSNIDAVMDAKKVNRAGDTMTGPLNVPSLTTTGGDVTAVRPIVIQGAYFFGNSGTRYLYYDGANFTLNGGGFTVNGAIWSVPTATVGTYFFGNSGSKYLSYDGVSFNFAGGQVVVPSLYSNGRLTGTTTGTDAQLRLVDQNNGSSKYLRNNANNLEFVNNAFSAVVMTMFDDGRLSLGAQGVNASDAVRVDQLNTKQASLGFTPTRQGGGAFQSSSDTVYLGWDGGGLRAQVNSSDLGKILTEQTGVSNIRLLLLGDVLTNASIEPNLGAVVCGIFGSTYRLRWLQLQRNPSGGAWATVGTA